MQPRTWSTLEHLAKAAWFSKVGIVDTSVATVLGSWSEAIESCASDEWQQLLNEALNRYCERIAERAPDEFAHWNFKCSMIRPYAMDLVKVKLASIAERESLPEIIYNCVQWDVIGLLMESEFAHVYAPGFFASQAYWYVKGHFPCGWDGEFPVGRLVIF